MKLTPQEQKTLEEYDKNASKFAATRNKEDWIEEKQRFKSYLPSGKVLDIGSGSGRDAKYFISLGYDYAGIEISENLIREAKKIAPNAKILHQSVYELDFPENTFDGFWACAVLLHMPKARIDEALKNIYKVTKNNGIGFVSLKKGEGERFVEGDSHGLSYKRFFSFWQEKEFSEVLIGNNFEVIESYEFEHSAKRWLAFFVRVKKA